jgi:hypothetical protein
MADFSSIAKQELQKILRLNAYRVQRKQTSLTKKVCDESNTSRELLPRVNFNFWGSRQVLESRQFAQSRSLAVTGAADAA